MHKRITVYDNSISARTYISYIAEQAGGFACIGRDGKLYIRTIGQDIAELPLKYFQKFKWGDKFKVSRVRYEDGIQLFETGDNTENTIYISQDNMYIVDQEQINNIYNQLNGLEIYSFEGDGIIDPAIDIGDLILIDGKYVIYQGSGQFGGRFKASISSKIQSKAQEETTTRKPSQTAINRRLQSEIDQEGLRITQLAQEQTEQSQKLTEHEQTIDKISSKVEDIEDLTQTVEAIKYLSLSKCIEGDLLELHIYGNNTVFDYLYCSDDLYCADDLYCYGDSRIVVLNYHMSVNGNPTEEVDKEETYELGITDVLRQNGDTCDEFVLKDGKAKVIRRINKDGSIKETEEVENLGELKIDLSSEYNEIYIKNYTAKIKARYAVKNEFTNTFATKVEMESKFELQSQNINIELSKKVDDNKIIASINMSTEKAEDGSQIKINADKLQLLANDILSILANNEINLGSKNITIKSDNFNVDKNGNMICSKANITGGKIDVSAEEGETILKIHCIDGEGIKKESVITPGSFDIYSRNDYDIPLVSAGIVKGNGEEGIIRILSNADDSETKIYSGAVNFWLNNLHTYIGGDKIETPILTQTSLEEIKKNIKKSNKNAIDIIKNSEIYEYNLKTEEDTDKKHIGFVIGEKYKTPSEVISKSKDGIDTYSMTSLLWLALKQETINKDKQISELEQRLHKLEKEEK